MAARHGVTLDDEQAAELAALDDATEETLLDGIDFYLGLGNQTVVVHNNIETYLMELGTIPQGPSLFDFGLFVD